MQAPPRARQGAPVVRLSVHLIATYKLLNRIYYERRRTVPAPEQHRGSALTAISAPLSEDCDDANGDYIVRIGEVWGGRFEVRNILGRGSFGLVVEAFDAVRGTPVAVKIIKNRAVFAQQALIEVRLLTELARFDTADQYFIVRLLDHFSWRRHLCLVFELLSYNLYELLRMTQFKGISLNLIRKFAYQILTALCFLAMPNINIVHCDLKPENILLRHPKRSGVKVIDFGSSCHASHRPYKYVQSRFYRAPEVILELEYGPAIDLWSLGCILVELHTGEALFAGEAELEQLWRMSGVLGPPPPHLLLRSPKLARFCGPHPSDPSLLQLLPPRHAVPPPRSLAQIVGAVAERRVAEAGHAPEDYARFLDLVARLLVYEAGARPPPWQLLQHDFFKFCGNAPLPAVLAPEPAHPP